MKSEEVLMGPSGAPVGDGGIDDSRALYNLEDEMVKLVAYTIVSVRRDAERVMPEGEGTIIVTDSMNGDAFTSWMIARYVQKRLATIAKEPDSEERERLDRDLEEVRRYLRIYFVVSYRWPREPLRFEKREIKALEQIRDAIENGE
jgi:hypothetical protein